MLLVAHSGDPGGSAAVLLSLLRHAPPAVEPRCLFLAPGETVACAEALGVPTEVVAVGRARELWRVPAAVHRVQQTIRAADAQVVFAHVAKAHIYAAPAASLQRVPYLWWEHEGADERPVMQWISARLPAAAVICSSRQTAEQEAHRTGPGTDVVQIDPGVEPPAVEPVGREDRSGSFVLGVVGRLRRWKRVELALRAMPRVLEAIPGARLRIVGGPDPKLDTDYPEMLREEAERLGVTGAVEFVGHVPDGAAAIADLDLLVHCAGSEPFGLVIVEALMRRVPVVVPHTGGPAAIVRDGVDGLTVDPENASALAAAVCSMAANPSWRASLASAGNMRVLERYTAQRMSEEAWRVVADVGAARRTG